MNSKQLPIPVRRALRKLGRDIKEARLRRRIPVAVLAERASISRQTLSNIENGFPGVSIGNYASTLFSLGLIDRFSDVANPTGDVVGMSLEEENLPKRVRPSSRSSYRKRETGE